MVKYRRLHAEKEPAESTSLSVAIGLMIVLIAIVVAMTSVGKTPLIDEEKKNESGIGPRFHGVETTDRRKRRKRAVKQLRRLRNKFRNATKQFRNSSSLFVQFEPISVEH